MYWYDEKGERYLTPEERILDAQQRFQGIENRAILAEEKLEAERQRAKRLEQLLQEMQEKGIDIDCNRSADVLRADVLRAIEF